MPILLDPQTSIDPLFKTAIPEDLYVIKAVDKPLYICYSISAAMVLGLAVFSSEEKANNYVKHFGSPIEDKIVIKEITFDEAYDIVKAKPTLNAIILLDDINNPIIHEVPKD